MAGARKKPAKKKMVRGPKQATMRQAPAGTSEEYERRSKALAKRHGWTDAERKRWANRQWQVDHTARRLADHAEDADQYPTLSAQDKALWRRGGTRSYDPYSRRAAVGEAISPTERTRREALARQKKEAAKKKATRAKKVASAKKAAPKRSPAKKRASPLKGRSYR